MRKKDDLSVGQTGIVKLPNVGAWEKDDASGSSNPNSSRVDPAPLRVAEEDMQIIHPDGDQRQDQPDDKSAMEIPGLVSSPGHTGSKSPPNPTTPTLSDVGYVVSPDNTPQNPGMKKVSANLLGDSGFHEDSDGVSGTVRFSEDPIQRGVSPISIPPVNRLGSPHSSRPTSQVGFQDGDNPMGGFSKANDLDADGDGSMPQNAVIRFDTSKTNATAQRAERKIAYSSEEMYIPLSSARAKVEDIVRDIEKLKVKHSQEIKQVQEISISIDEESKKYFESFMSKYKDQMRSLREGYARELKKFKEEKRALEETIANLKGEKSTFVAQSHESLEKARKQVESLDHGHDAKMADIIRQYEEVIRKSHEEKEALAYEIQQLKQGSPAVDGVKKAFLDTADQPGGSTISMPSARETKTAHLAGSHIQTPPEDDSSRSSGAGSRIASLEAERLKLLEKIQLLESERKHPPTSGQQPSGQPQDDEKLAGIIEENRKLKDEIVDLRKENEHLSDRSKIFVHVTQLADPLPSLADLVPSITSLDEKQRAARVLQVKQKISVQHSLLRSKLDSSISQFENENGGQLTESQKESLRGTYEKYLTSNGLLKCVTEYSESLKSLAAKSSTPQGPEDSNPSVLSSQILDLKAQIKAYDEDATEKMKKIESLEKEIEILQKREPTHEPKSAAKADQHYESAAWKTEKAALERKATEASDLAKRLELEINGLKKKLVEATDPSRNPQGSSQQSETSGKTSQDTPVDSFPAATPLSPSSTSRGQDQAQEIIQIKSTVSKLQDEVQQKDQAIKQRDEKIDSIQGELRQLKDSIRDQDSGQQIQELASARFSLENTKKENQTLKDTIETLQGELRQLKESIKGQDSGQQIQELASAKSSLESAKKENQTLKDTIASLQQQGSDVLPVETKTKELGALVESLKTQLSQSDDKIRSLESRERVLSSELENMNLTVQNSKILEENLRSQIQALENATLSGQSGNAEFKVMGSQLESLRSEAGSLRDEAKALQSEIDSLKGQLQDSNKDREKLLGQLHASQKECDDVRSTVSALESKNTTNEENLSKMKAESISLSQKNAQLEQEIKKLEEKTGYLSFQSEASLQALDLSSQEVNSLMMRLKSVPLEPHVLPLIFQSTTTTIQQLLNDITTLKSLCSNIGSDIRPLLSQSLSVQTMALIASVELDVLIGSISGEFKNPDVNSAISSFSKSLPETRDKLSQILKDISAFRSSAAGASTPTLQHSMSFSPQQLSRKSDGFQVSQQMFSTDSKNFVAPGKGLIGQVDSVLSTIDQFKKSLDGLQQKLNSADLESQSQKSQTSALSKQIEFVQGQLASAQTDIEGLKSQNAKLTGENEGLHRDLKQSRSEADELNQKLSAEVTEKGNVSAQLKKAKSDIDALNDKVSSLSAQIKSAETTINSLETNTQKAQSEIGALQTQLKASQSQNNSLQAQVKSLQSDVTKFQAEATNISQQDEQKKLILSERMKQVETLTSQLKAAEEASQARDLEAKKEIATLNANIVGLKKNLQQETDDHVVTKGKLEATIKEHTEQIKVLNDRHQEQNQKVEQEFKNKMDETVKDHQNKLAEEKAKAEKLQEAIAKLTDALKQYKEMIEKMKAKIEEQNKKGAELQASIDTLTTQLKESQDATEATKQQLATTEAELAKTKDEREKLMKAVQKLKEVYQKENEDRKAAEEIIAKQNEQIKAQTAQIEAQTEELRKMDAAIEAQKESEKRQKQAEKAAEELKNKFKDEQLIRKKIHNELEDIKGKVRVYCRVRPMSQKEIEVTSFIF
eukprot:TRINITY_DN2090_c0_g2_i2.p1 TRINITY_DN2090_c0_g2~~TRINITY_DN2090_c0_g2_i2.p1  ORF type:complete len:1786 (-),score=422.87 TRINITY_DN2090_c0_g2_i2:1365-6722(-)